MRRRIVFLLAASLLCYAHFGSKDYLQLEATSVRERDVDVNISQVYPQPEIPIWIHDTDRFNFTVTEDGTNAYDLTGKDIYFAGKKYLSDTNFIFLVECDVDDATGGLCHADFLPTSVPTAGVYQAGIRITQSTNVIVTAWIGKLKARGVIDDGQTGWTPPEPWTNYVTFSQGDARYGQKIPGHSNLWQSGFDDFRTSDVRVAEPTETNQPTTKNYVDNTIGALDTDDIPEGFSNLYYTEARDNANFTSNWNTKTTTHLPEGDNLYWTLARFSSAFANMTTADLTESNNLYWTQARFDTAFSGKTTDNLGEGLGNLYYTEARGSNTFENVWPTKDLDDLPDGPTYVRVTSAEKTDYDTAYSWGNHANGGYASTNSVNDVSNRVNNIEANTNSWNDVTNTLYSFNFVIPSDPDNDNLHFQIEIDNDTDFSSTIVDACTTNSVTGWQYFGGTSFQTFPAEGITSANYGNTLVYTPTNEFVRGAQHYTRIRAHDGIGWGNYEGGKIIP